MDINEAIVRHDGVITTELALQCGVTRSAIARHVKAARWTRVARGVFLVAGHFRSDRAQARIAVHSIGPDAVLAGVAAAWWHGIEASPPTKQLVLTGHRGTHTRRSSTAMPRFRRLDDVDVVSKDGLRATSVELSLVDAAIERGIDVLDRGLLTKRVTLQGLRDAHGRYPKRHGGAVVSTYLDLLGDGTRSAAERILAPLLEQLGVAWVAGLAEGDYEIDFAFPAAMLAVEVDGFAFHRDAKAFQHDRTRRNALIAKGWTVLNFTWADLIERPEHVLESIMAELQKTAA
ncbi:DUF559 domain-containing protein [Gordonia sputi]